MNLIFREPRDRVLKKLIPYFFSSDDSAQLFQWKINLFIVDII